MVLLDGFLSKLGDGFLPAIIASAGTLLTGYVIIRERILKNEIKMDNLYEHMKNRDELFNNKILELQTDVSDFKAINKETNRSMAENTSAVRELKVVLEIMRQQLIESREDLKDAKEGRSFKKKPPTEY